MNKPHLEHRGAGDCFQRICGRPVLSKLAGLGCVSIRLTGLNKRLTLPSSIQKPSERLIRFRKSSEPSLLDYIISILPGQRIRHHIVVGAQVGSVQMEAITGFNRSKHLKQIASEGVACLSRVDPVDDNLVVPMYRATLSRHCSCWHTANNSTASSSVKAGYHHPSGIFFFEAVSRVRCTPREICILKGLSFYSLNHPLVRENVEGIGPLLDRSTAPTLSSVAPPEA